MTANRRLLYPDPLIGSLPPVELTDSIQLIDQYGTAAPSAYRIPLLFETPARVLIRVTSVEGELNNWLRAGSLAQVLAGLPGDPKKSVQRLYLDERFFEFEGAGYSYYLEFWPVRWLTDYFLEVWAQLPQTIVVIDGGEAFSLDGEAFTIDGIALLI